jgi:hypothetical protein
LRDRRRDEAPGARFADVIAIVFAGELGLAYVVSAAGGTAVGVPVEDVWITLAESSV